MSNKDINSALYDASFAQQNQHQQSGYQRGLNAGIESGWRDGFVFGLRKGAQIASEIGYYQGFAQTWIALLEQSDEKQRKLKALHSLLELTQTFPKENNDDDLMQKLVRLRAKFKQVNSLVCGVTGNSSTFSGPSWSDQNTADQPFNGCGSQSEMSF